MAGWGMFAWDVDAWQPLPEIPAGGSRPGTGDFIAGLPGMVVDTRKAEKISRIPETDISFGTAVLAGQNDAYCRSAANGDSGHPYEAAEVRFLGIAMRDMTSAGGTINLERPGFDGYPKGNWCVSIICAGRVWVTAQSAVRERDPVVILPDGTFMTSDNPDWFIPRARWVTSAPAGRLAVVEINMPSIETG